MLRTDVTHITPGDECVLSRYRLSSSSRPWERAANQQYRVSVRALLCLPSAAERANQRDCCGEAAVHDVDGGALFVEEASLDGHDVQEADGSRLVLVHGEIDGLARGV